MSVRRWSADCLIKSNEGGFVEHTDYLTLLRQRDALRALLAEWRSSYSGAYTQDESDELDARTYAALREERE